MSDEKTDTLKGPHLDNTIIESHETEQPIPEPELDEVEQSAQYIQVLFTQFRKYGYGLANRKKRAPIRVLEAFLFHGLHDVELMGKDEKELLALCQQTMYHKNKLINYMLEKRKKEENKNEQKEMA